MAPLKFLSLANASVLFLYLPAAYAASPENKAVRADCLVAMNEARSPAGLAPFTNASEDAEKLPIDGGHEETKAQYLTSVCEAMKASASPGQRSDIKPDATFAFALQDGDVQDCQAAVEYWKGAFTNFEGLPAPYTKDQKPYDNPLNVSFIALFNPKENPKVDCAYVTCPAATSNGGSRTTSGTDDKGVHGLLCATTPKALVADHAPFEQGQWDKITAAFTGSASSAAPTFIALAAAALGIALF